MKIAGQINYVPLTCQIKWIKPEPVGNDRQRAGCRIVTQQSELAEKLRYRLDGQGGWRIGIGKGTS